jgi:hypothetical protein
MRDTVASRSRAARCFIRVSNSSFESFATDESIFASMHNTYHGRFASIRNASIWC